MERTLPPLDYTDHGCICALSGMGRRAACPAHGERATTLWLAWVDAWTALEGRYSESAHTAEQDALDELVDYVEANDLNYTGLDPRNAILRGVN